MRRVRKKAYVDAKQRKLEAKKENAELDHLKSVARSVKKGEIFAVLLDFILPFGNIFINLNSSTIAMNSLSAAEETAG